MADSKKTKKSKAKSQVEVNPEVETDLRTLRVEALSRIGRLRLKRAMKRTSRSGKLARGKRKMATRAMTANRATGLGWRSARRQLKAKLGGKSVSKMSASEKSRIEKRADSRKEIQKVMARKNKRALLSQSFDPINNAFEMMLEGKRYHQLMNKNGTVKIDKRFKQYRADVKAKMSEQTIMSMLSTLDENIHSENIDLVILEMLVDNDTSKTVAEHALSVSKSLSVDYNELMEKYRDC